MIKPMNPALLTTIIDSNYSLRLQANMTCIRPGLMEKYDDITYGRDFNAICYISDKAVKGSQVDFRYLEALISSY